LDFELYFSAGLTYIDIEHKEICFFIFYFCNSLCFTTLKQPF
jgi:hypothetical protein